MKNRKLTEYQKLVLHRKQKRKRRIKRFLVTLFVLLTVSALLFSAYHIVGVFNGNTNIRNIFVKKLNAKTLETPDYVSQDLIHLGLARKGIALKEINSIVVHYTGNAGTTAQNNRDYFDKIDTTVCSHFVIGIDGEIIQCVPLNERSAASNNRNVDSISIEVCHMYADGKFTDETYNSLVKLTAWLCDNSNLDEKDVIRHYDVTGKLCPLYYVENETEWGAFLQDVADELKTY